MLIFQIIKDYPILEENCLIVLVILLIGKRNKTKKPLNLQKTMLCLLEWLKGRKMLLER